MASHAASWALKSFGDAKDFPARARFQGLVRPFHAALALRIIELGRHGPGPEHHGRTLDPGAKLVLHPIPVSSKSRRRTAPTHGAAPISRPADPALRDRIVWSGRCPWCPCTDSYERFR
ncbi:hypothetical protein [Arthrobacter methylotrophus]|uniref:hypothetical protein n=1 Tax=Arthrobacter methylotrophus TaxID=121291 RepID=UPI0031F18FD0